MKPNTALFFQVVIVLFGSAVLAFMLIEPHLEGRNAHSSVFQIYFNDPFLAYVYAASIPFFIALHRGFRLAGDFRREVASPASTVVALHVIRRCALAIVVFAIGAAGFVIALGDGEDRPGGIFMCGLVILGSGVVAIAASLVARTVQGSQPLETGDGRTAV